MSTGHTAAVRQVGWRENIALPELGIRSVRAKIDTGARTSAIHAEDIEPFDHNGTPSIRFRVPLSGMAESAPCIAPLVDERPIKNTSGVPELRYVIETTLVLGKRHWGIEVSLTNRDQMGFSIILGRTAIRRHWLLVNPARSFLWGAPRLTPAVSRPSSKSDTKAHQRDRDLALTNDRMEEEE